jgi:type I restriction enzyme M protein
VDKDIGVVCNRLVTPENVKTFPLPDADEPSRYARYDETRRKAPGGFLIAAYEHILLANASPDLIREKNSVDGQWIKYGIGDRLKRSQWDFLQKGTLHGFESDPDILRLAAMNAVLHQFDQSPLIRRDSICGSEDKWDEVQFDVILENPPFSGSRGDAKRSLRIEKGDKYVLFLAHALRSLRQGGTAGIRFAPNTISAPSPA